ncbi:MAG: hypothetical protein V4850_00545 [Myxococcota bacterium]
MLLLLASLAVLAPARADSITLDSGATIEGDLARYEFGGDCQLSVTEGPLTGVIVIVPCHRVQSFMRTSVRTPVAIGLQNDAALEEESVSATAGLDALPVVAGDSASAAVPVQASVEPTQVVPVAAPPSPRAEARTETRALSFGQGAGAVELPAEDPRAEADEEPFYDEPLFPSDPTEPIGFAPSEPPAASRSSSSPSSGTGASGVTDTAPQRSAAPAPVEPTGPRMAPRMDEPSTERRVNF